MAMGILTGAVVYLLISWAIATEFHIIAQEKGYSERKYLWYCFLFGIIGYLMVIALPDRGKRYVTRTTYSSAPATPKTPTSTQSSGDFWICPTCHTKNLNSRDTCWSCNPPKS